MKKYICVIICLLVTFSLLAERVESLVGKYVQLTPFNLESKYINSATELKPIVFSPNVLIKGDFNKKHLLNNQDIFGVNLLIKGVKVLNEGKKDEAMAIIADRDNEEIVIYLPLRFNAKEPPFSSVWYNDLESESGFINIYKRTNKRFIDIPYYDANLIDSISQAYTGKIVYPVRSYKHGYINDKKESTWYRRRNNIISGNPYVFDGLSYSMPFGSIIYLTADLRDSDGNIFRLPIEMKETYLHNRVNTGRRMDTPSLEEFSQYMLTEDSLLSILKSQHIQYADSISPLIGKEIFVIGSDLYGYNINENDTRNLHQFTKSDFYKLECVMLMPSVIREYPYFNRFAILTNNSGKYAFPITSSSVSYISDGLQKREEDKLQKEEYQRRERERQALEDAEEQQYKNSLIKKFGQKNAELIVEGRVKLGFTKAMCEEAWGLPYDTTRVTTKFGTAEAWWYGDGTILYFQGNKLVIIQD